MKIPVQPSDAMYHEPRFSHPGDAGADLTASEAAVIPAGERALIGTGFAVAIPDGHAGLVMPRSGLAVRNGVTVVNAPGLIDSGYRGEVKVALINHGSDDFVIERGDRIAQLVIVAVPAVEFVEVDDLAASERGTGGFGSTGVSADG